MADIPDITGLPRWHRYYAEGLLDGFEITLRLLEGEAVHGAVAYTGPRPSELEQWIEKAKKKIEEQKAERTA